MSVGVMEDYKLRDLHTSHTLVGRGTGTKTEEVVYYESRK
jgi:hypothetical protein